jgi:phospholipase C
LTGGLAPGPDGQPQIDNPDVGRFDPLEVATVFDHLSVAGVAWRYYEHDFSMLRLFSRYTFDNDHIVSMDDPERGFYAASRRGELPPVAFIDPDLTDIPPGTDDHPPSDIQDGQALVRRIYDALSQGPQWEKTLFVVVYDEHGGFYDHVHPPRQRLFDHRHPEAGGFVPLAMDPHTGGPIDFYGMRVPALVVSPWVRAGEVSKTEYDHTTILKTIMARFLPSRPPGLGRRVAIAPDLGPLLSLDTPRPAVHPQQFSFRPDRRPLPSMRLGLPSDDFRAFVGAFRRRVRGQ